MKRSMVILGFSALTGCEVGESTASPAYQEAMVSSEARQVVDDAVAFHQPGKPRGPLELVTQMRTFIEEGSTCAEITEDGEAIVVDFGEEGCTYQGRTFSGVVYAVFTDGEDATQMDLSFEGLSDGRVILTGTASASLSDAYRDIQAELDVERLASDASSQRTRGPRHPDAPSAFTLTASRRVEPLEGSFETGSVLDGTRTMSADELEATITEDGLELRAGDRVPQAGTVTHDGPRGAATIWFERLSDEVIEVTVDGPAGADSFQVDPQTGERL